MTRTVFIDGEVGTTGLQIRARLADHADLTVISLPETERKLPAKRAEAANDADVVVLCLPDDAAREAMTWIDTASTRVIDTSTAHRTDPAWVYGFAELSADQAVTIAGARMVSNPGCYPTGAVALLRPLTASGVLPDDYPISIHAVSGYSGGGRKLIERFEREDDPSPIDSTYYLYALALRHKHVPEIETHAGLSRRPLFVPSVGRFRQGMAVQVPLHLEDLSGATSPAAIRAILADWYAGQSFVEVAPGDTGDTIERLDPEMVNGTNLLRLYVFGDTGTGHAYLVAVLDNLGKGASGAAVQNLNLMLGLDPAAGLLAR